MEIYNCSTSCGRKSFAALWFLRITDLQMGLAWEERICRIRLRRPTGDETLKSELSQVSNARPGAPIDFCFDALFLEEFWVPAVGPGVVVGREVGAVLH